MSRPPTVTAVEDWDDLRYVLAIAEAGSLAAAADRLGVNHSTAWRRLNRLEDALGVRLFERRPEGYAPTPAGEEAAARARQMAEAAAALDRHVTGSEVSLSGVVRVTAADTVAEYLLMPMLVPFRARYPAIEIEVVVSNAFFSLARREADVALRPTRMPEGDAVGRRVSDIAFARYAAPEIADLPEDARPFIGFGDELSHLAAAEWVAANVAPGNLALRCNTIPAQIAAATAGLGAALLPCFAAAHMEAAGRLVRLGGTEPTAKTGLWLLTHADLRGAARIRAFLDHIGQAIRGLRPLLEGGLADTQP